MLKLIWFTLFVSLTFGVVLTDYEQYQQMSKYIEIHSPIVADRPMVDRIMDSARWIKLHAQFGPQSKK